MKKYLFLAEKRSVAKLFEKIYEKNKEEFDFEATFVGMNASTWNMFDKFRYIDFLIEYKIDVSKYNLPDIFYLLGYNNLKNIIDTIDLSKYDKIISIVDPDIYGAMLIHHFANLKQIELSNFCAANINSLTNNDIYNILKNIKEIKNCEKFVNDLVNSFKEDLYVVKNYIFIYEKNYKISLTNGDLVLLIKNKNNYTLVTGQVSVELTEDEIKKFNIKESLTKY